MLELRADSLTVLLIHLGIMTVIILKMLECSVSCLVLKETSDCKEELQLVDVLRFATTTSGAQCVMTFGVIKMHKLSAISWDLPPLVGHIVSVVIVAFNQLL